MLVALCFFYLLQDVRGPITATNNVCCDEEKKNIESVYLSRKAIFILFIFPFVTKNVPNS